VTVDRQAFNCRVPDFLLRERGKCTLRSIALLEPALWVKQPESGVVAMQAGSVGVDKFSDIPENLFLHFNLAQGLPFGLNEGGA
jgi:hypothetical protein